MNLVMFCCVPLVAMSVVSDSEGEEDCVVFGVSVKWLSRWWWSRDADETNQHHYLLHSLNQSKSYCSQQHRQSSSDMIPLTDSRFIHAKDNDDEDVLILLWDKSSGQVSDIESEQVRKMSLKFHRQENIRRTIKFSVFKMTNGDDPFGERKTQHCMTLSYENLVFWVHRLNFKTCKLNSIVKQTLCRRQ